MFLTSKQVQKIYADKQNIDMESLKTYIGKDLETVVQSLTKEYPHVQIKTYNSKMYIAKVFLSGFFRVLYTDNIVTEILVC